MITSRLDTDFYLFTMGSTIHHRFPSYTVRFEFRNRTFAVPLGECLDLDVLQQHIEAYAALRFTDAELEYLRSTGHVSNAYLEYIARAPLPMPEVSLNDGHLVLEVEGPWQSTLHWETPLLATISELYYERFNASVIEGIRRLKVKIDHLQQRPSIKFIEFGTRRRYSAAWQNYVMQEVKETFGLQGTSNVQMARYHDLTPVGTMAHQLFMVVASLCAGNVIDAYDMVLEAWEATHGDLLIALSDTFGTPHFLKHMGSARLRQWAGFRQDSGDPIEVGRRYLDAWYSAGINPLDKRIVFSDGLDLRMMNVLLDYFESKTNVSFGWGTNLTNDLGFEPLSLVMKPKSVDGVPCVKLSDNLAKATGDPVAIERFKRATGHHIDYRAATRY